jgi:hypothetical protein
MKAMNLKDLAAWLQNMNELTNGCVLELRATERGELTLDLSWRHNGRAQGYEHALSGIELRQMRDTVQASVLEQIGHRVAASMREPPNNSITRALPERT